MIYRFFNKDNFVDFSSGRVLYHKSGFPNFPVRLAGELFSRCLELTGKDRDIILYDPCCGCGYTVTVLGFLFNSKIKTIFASDILEEAVETANKNLSLLTHQGIEKRRNY